MTRQCSITTCSENAYCKGYCRKHYNRFRLHGDPTAGRPANTTPDVKFWRYVDRRGDNECWPWTGMFQKNGYGRMGVGQFGKVLAHRLSHKIATGEEPEVVMHTCDNRWCVNPAHLRSGTYATNNADMRVKGRDNRTARPRGEGHHRALVNADDVRAIRASTKTLPALAAEYGLSLSAVSKIYYRYTWKHIT